MIRYLNDNCMNAKSAFSEFYAGVDANNLSHLCTIL